MKDVEMSYVIEAGRNEIEERLTPEQIVEYMGYTVQDAKRTSDEEVLVGRKSDIELQLRFRERNRGYTFSQYGTNGPYREMDAELWVGDEPNAAEEITASRVSVRFSYTFGSVFAFLVDWLARGTVETEVEGLLSNLTRDVVNDKGESEDGRRELDARVEGREEP